jgi:hypothetical protein
MDRLILSYLEHAHDGSDRFIVWCEELGQKYLEDGHGSTLDEAVEMYVQNATEWADWVRDYVDCVEKLHFQLPREKHE